MKVHLRPIVMADFPAIHDYAGDPDVTRTFRWGPNSREQTIAIMEGWMANKWPMARGIENEFGEIVGVAELRQDGSVGYTIRHKFWHQGYAGAALVELIELARSLDMPFVWGTCRETNAASRAILGREMEQRGTRDVHGVEMLYFEKLLR